VQVEGFRIAVPNGVLILGMLASIFRFVFCLDPEGTYGLYKHTTYEALVTYNFPYTLASSLLVSMYWHKSCVEATNTEGSKSIISYIIQGAVLFFSVAIILIETLSAILKSNWIEPAGLLTLTGLIYLFTSFGVALYLLITSALLIRRLKVLPNANIKKYVKYIAVSATGLLMLTIGALFVATPAYAIPVLFTLSDWLAYTGTEAVTIANALVIKVPGSASRSITKDDATKEASTTTGKDSKKDSERESRTELTKESNTESISVSEELQVKLEVKEETKVNGNEVKEETQVELEVKEEKESSSEGESASEKEESKEDA